MKINKLIGQNIILRKVRKSDIRDRVACGRVDEFSFMYGAEANEDKFSLKDGIAWFDSHENRQGLSWVIEYHDKCIGDIFLHQINKEDRRARMAIGIFDKNYVSKGLGTEAVKLVLCHAFRKLNFHRIDLRVLSYNKRAIKSYKKAGFKKEGVERETAFVRGKWRDDVIMSILDHEYKA